MPHRRFPVRHPSTPSDPDVARVLAAAGLTRRTFLRGAGGVAIGLPLLEIMGCSGKNPDAVGSRLASLDTQPRRFVVFWSPKVARTRQFGVMLAVTATSRPFVVSS